MKYTIRPICGAAFQHLRSGRINSILNVVMWNVRQLLHHLSSPLFPIAIERDALGLFSQWIDWMERHNTMNAKRWTTVKQAVALADLDLARTPLLKASVMRFLDVLIRH